MKPLRLIKMVKALKVALVLKFEYPPSMLLLQIARSEVASYGGLTYTDHSDLVAVLVHTGYCRPTASPPPPTIQELHATIRVLPPQDCYTSKLRNNVHSRAWGAGIGCSYRVEQCCIVKKGGGTIDLEPLPYAFINCGAYPCSSSCRTNNDYWGSSFGISCLFCSSNFLKLQFVLSCVMELLL